MLRLLRNSILLMGGTILAFALALVLGLFSNAPQTSTAQQSNPGSASMPAQAAPNQPNGKGPSTSSALPGNPRQYPLLDRQSVAQLTADWPTFENQEFGFRIKYPPNFLTGVWPVEGDRLFYVSFANQRWKDSPGEVPDIGLVVYRNPQGFSLDEWFQKHSGNTTPDGNLPEDALFVDPTQVEQVTVNGQAALKFVDGGLGPAPSTLIFKRSQLFKLYFAPPSVAPSENLEPIYEQMLSTLEFTK